ncbi:hypothetical protein HanPSC8_Chr08g0335101 [Helianthus annuus]|nr:hypothetical protein HanPSC8_Chr08g0335101 [Helianthus annuus]
MRAFLYYANVSLCNYSILINVIITFIFYFLLIFFYIRCFEKFQVCIVTYFFLYLCSKINFT